MIKVINETDVLGNNIIIGDRVCFYWQTKTFGRMITGIVVDYNIDDKKFAIQTGHGIFKRGILEIVGV